jgi:protein-S-isoprenylcysteine O-methyltransferase Ste14
LGPIAAGCTGFLVLLLFDWADSRGLRRIKPWIMIGASALFTYALVAILSDPGRFHLPLALRIAGAVLSLPFFLLFVFSIFLEIPFRLTYGAKDGERGVVTTGTYALSRHPGVIWFFLFHACLILLTCSWLLLAALPFWTGMNIFLVFVEDRVFFPRTFGDSYLEYRRRTPFLVPTPASVGRCIRTFSFALPRRKGDASKRSSGS